MAKRVKRTEGQSTRVLFPVPIEIVEEILKYAKCDKCNFDHGDYTNRQCRGCKKLICNECDVYWSKCTGKVTECLEDPFSGYNAFRIIEKDCIYMSGNKWCYDCVRSNRKQQLICPKCKKIPSFVLPGDLVK